MRIFRYKLRTLLLATILIAIPTAYYANLWNRVRSEHAGIEILRAQGWVVGSNLDSFDGNSPESRGTLNRVLTFPPRYFFGEQAVAECRRITLTKNAPSKAGSLDILQRFNNLNVLKIAFAENLNGVERFDTLSAKVWIREEDVQTIANLKINYLELRADRIGGLQHLTDSTIKYLAIEDDFLDQSQYEAIGQMKALHSLILLTDSVHEANFQAIGKNQLLKEFQLYTETISGLRGLRNDSLEHLSVKGELSKPDDFDVSDLPKLSFLDIQQTNLGDECLPALLKNQSLSRVAFGQSQISGSTYDLLTAHGVMVMHAGLKNFDLETNVIRIGNEVFQVDFRESELQATISRLPNINWTLCVKATQQYAADQPRVLISPAFDPPRTGWLNLVTGWPVLKPRGDQSDTISILERKHNRFRVTWDFDLPAESRSCNIDCWLTFRSIIVDGLHEPIEENAAERLQKHNIDARDFRKPVQLNDSSVRFELR